MVPIKTTTFATKYKVSYKYTEEKKKKIVGEQEF